jgi:hypothetical protein
MAKPRIKIPVPSGETLDTFLGKLLRVSKKELDRKLAAEQRKKAKQRTGGT